MNVKGAMFQGKQAEVILTKAIITIEVLKSFFFFSNCRKNATVFTYGTKYGEINPKRGIYKIRLGMAVRRFTTFWASSQCHPRGWGTVMPIPEQDKQNG